MNALTTDLLVIGGGATGLGVAWDARLRGLSVVVLEQGDLGQGTSGRYHGLLHSGGRYAISDPASARDCARENAILRRIVPHTIEDTGGLFLATPGDSQTYVEQWLAACRREGVAADEISSSEALRREPLLNPSLRAAFLVEDAALDSFDLLHALAEALTRAGGAVLLRHRLERLTPRPHGFLAAASTPSGGLEQIEARVVVNAAGPFAGRIARMAGADLPLALGKGTMIAMATRLVNTVVNRLKFPADGDIIVPVGTVAVLGTTDTPVDDADNVGIETWEIDLLLQEAAALVPSIQDHRPLRAWAGIRPLYRPPAAASYETRQLPRAHALIDHGSAGGPEGLVTIIGGKLTTYRRMAEDTVDLVAKQLGSSARCRTDESVLSPPPQRFHRLPDRLENLRASGVVCECELVSTADIQHALEASGSAELDDLRRDLRLGMGPCQAAFCAYRSAGLLFSRDPRLNARAALESFLEERWRGLRPLMWAAGLRQLEFNRRVYMDLLAVDRS